MAVTQEQSIERAAVTAEPRQKLFTTEQHGRVRASHFHFTQGAAAGDAGSLAELITLPPGRLRLLSVRGANGVLGTGRTLDIGHLGYTDADTAVGAVAADPDAFSADTAVATAGTFDLLIDAVVHSKDGFVLTAQINDGTLPAAGTLSGFVLYVVD